MKAKEPITPALADDFKTRAGLWHTKIKPKGEVKGVTDLPLFLGEKEKHEAKQAAAQSALF